MIDILRDQYGKIIGKIHTLSNGKMEIRNSSGKKLGTYDPKTNYTRDQWNKIIGRGNLLTTLL